jgi:hypothetical protein
MKFSDDRAACIDTGASCSISNCKDDFITFAPSSSTILKGISRGLNIASTGTLKWNILDDNGDDIALHLHNSLYVPDAPMCLLSPQHMAQQTSSTADGFTGKGSFGLLTFGGYHRTIHFQQPSNPISCLRPEQSPIYQCSLALRYYSCLSQLYHII